MTATPPPSPAEPTKQALDAFIARAGFAHGWANLESWARRMAERAVIELAAHAIVQDAAAAPASAQASEPTLYQYRMRPGWVKPEQWQAWADCTAQSAADYERTPVLHDWHYEVRRLYLAAQAPQAPAGQEWQPIETAAKHGEPAWLFDPALIDSDYNPTGTVDGHWQDDAGWTGAVWDGYRDEWTTTAISPTHWMPRTSPATASGAKA